MYQEKEEDVKIIPKITFDSNIDLHAQYIVETTYKQQYPTNPKKVYHKLVCRIHGGQQACRFALLIPILVNIYRYFGDNEALKIDEAALKLIQLCALFHSSGREKDSGDDEWILASAENLYKYLINIAGAVIIRESIKINTG